MPPLSIPSTLQASLLARLDRLASVKDVAHIGAVIGREFSYGLIAAVAGLPERDLKRALAQLVGAELIFQRGVPPDATYQFKHALVQDAAYSSLIRSRRQQLHGLIARALEQSFPERVTAEPETLAYHFAEAALRESAIEYWLKAGQRASESSAEQEAIRHLERGLALVHSLPESADRDRLELNFQVSLFAPLRAVRGYTDAKVVAARERATVLAERLDDPERLIVSLYANFANCSMTGQTRKALEYAKRCQALGIRENDRAMQLMGHRAIGNAMILLGELAQAQSAFENVLALYDLKSDRLLATKFGADPYAASATHLAQVLWISGYPDRAARMQAQALTFATELNHANTNIYVRLLAGAASKPIEGATSDGLRRCRRCGRRSDSAEGVAIDTS